MSERQLSDGIDALKVRGTFNDGVFTWMDDQGKKNNQDAYEAVREHVFGQSVRYSGARYESPVLFDPARFDYVDLQRTPGVQERHLGTFNERRSSLKMLRMEAGATTTFSDPRQTTLFFCVQGSGLADQFHWQSHSAFEVLATREAAITAVESSEFYVFGLPIFST